MSVALKNALGGVWTNAEVAALYRYRPAYPEPVFGILRGLMSGSSTILDVGCGTGALARRMTPFAARVDAVDRSEAMIAEGKRLPGGDDRRIRWLVGTAETAPLEGPYGLITTGQSLHWMDHDVVMPRFHDALAERARLAAPDIDWDFPPEWREELVAIIRTYSPTRSTFSVDLFGDLQRRGLFERQGFRKTTDERVDMPIDDFVRMQQSTSSLATVTLKERSDAFAADVRRLFARRGLDRVSFAVAAGVVWGRPLRP